MTPPPPHFKHLSLLPPPHPPPLPPKNFGNTRGKSSFVSLLLALWLRWRPPARDEFVSKYLVPRIITQYQGLSGFLFFKLRLVEPGRVSDISGCFPNLDHIHCPLLMFCSPSACQKLFPLMSVDFRLLIVTE